MNRGPHAREHLIASGPSSPGPWGWQCPACGLENVVRELACEGGDAGERPCDYCGAVYELPHAG